MGFLKADFILVASKLVFTKVSWRFENVPQLKFKYFQGPKWMSEEEFQEFSRPSTQKFIGFQGFQDAYEPCANFDNPIASFSYNIWLSLVKQKQQIAWNNRTMLLTGHTDNGCLLQRYGWKPNQ